MDKKVPDPLIVNLRIANSNCNRLIKLVASKGVDLSDGSGQDAAVFELGLAAGHRVSLACAGLTIAEDCSIVTFDDTLDDFGGALLIDFVLACIVQDFFELELPLVGLVVHEASFCVFVVPHHDCSFALVDFHVLGCEVSCWPGADDHSNRLL